MKASASDHAYSSDRETDDRASDEGSPVTSDHSPTTSSFSRSSHRPTHHSSSSTRRQHGGSNGHPHAASLATAAAPQPQQPRSYSVTELVRTLSNYDGTTTGLPPELERRTLDFRLAQNKRRAKYGSTERTRCWGIYGLYQHLSSVRIDLEWAEDAAWRRQHGEPYLSWQDFDEARLQSIRNVPWLTYAFVVICSIMMIVEFGVNDWKVEPLSVNPMIGPSGETLIQVGARYTPKIVEEGEWYRLFSPLILHAGLIHYFINMLALWLIGKALEQNHGMFTTLVLFMVPGVGANILSAIFLPEYISVGASGGLFGLIGALTTDLFVNWKILSIRSEHETENEVRRRNMIAIVIICMEIGVNILIGLVTPFIDNWAHLGGLIYGSCCAFSTLQALPVGFFGVVDTTWDKIKKVSIRFCGLIVTLVLILISTVWLATADPGETPCSACRYVSCIPFPPFQEEKWWYCDKCDFVTATLVRGDDSFYQKITLFCPDDSLETFDVSDDRINNQQVIEQKLPTYCREYCDDVY